MPLWCTYRCHCHHKTIFKSDVMTSDKRQVGSFNKKVMKYDIREEWSSWHGCSFFLNSLTIKRRFIRFTSITVSFASYKRMGLCPMRNKDKIASLTLFRKERVKKSNIKWLRKQTRPHLPREAMTGTAVTQQSTMPLRQHNQIQATGDKDAAEEVVP